MKSIYITSIERFSGKTATCLAIGLRLKREGLQVGYIKPLSLQPWRIANHVADEDAAFVKEVLGLEAQAWELSPVVITPEYLKQHLKSDQEINLYHQVKTACDSISIDKDVLIAEGGSSLREGYVVGLPTSSFSAKFGCKVLLVIKYQDEIRLLDDALASQERLGEALRGILINRIPEEVGPFLKETVIPFLQKKGIPVFGVLPEEHGLAALTVQEIIQVLDAQVLTKDPNLEAMVENLTVGAMTADAALSRFRKQTNKGVITGGDRTDIQLAALETSTTCLILTGNLHPSPLIIKQAEEFGVPILLVSANTMETIEAVERVFGKTRLGQPAKLSQFVNLMDIHVDFNRIWEAFEIKK